MPKTQPKFKIQPNQFRAARAYLGLSQPFFAKAFGVSLPTIGNWERDGKDIPSHWHNALIDFFETYGVTFTEIGINSKNSSISIFNYSEGLRKFVQMLHNYLNLDKKFSVKVIGIKLDKVFELFKANNLSSNEINDMKKVFKEIRTSAKNVYSGSITSFILLFKNKLAIILPDPLEIVVIDKDSYTKDLKLLLNL